MIHYIPRPCYQLEKKTGDRRRTAQTGTSVLYRVEKLPSHARALEKITSGVYSSNTSVQLEKRCHPDTNANPQHAAQD